MDHFRCCSNNAPLSQLLTILVDLSLFCFVLSNSPFTSDQVHHSKILGPNSISSSRPSLFPSLCILLFATQILTVGPNQSRPNRAPFVSLALSLSFSLLFVMSTSQSRLPSEFRPSQCPPTKSEDAMSLLSASCTFSASSQCLLASRRTAPHNLTLSGSTGPSLWRLGIRLDAHLP